MPGKTKNSPIPIITLLTDFGDTDAYAGAMKGVILSHCPNANLVDISHNIRPYDITSASYILSTYWNRFPKGTIHIAIIDPGVGSTRKPLAIKHQGHWFILPDNGLITYTLAQNAKHTARIITKEFTPGDNISSTFHGRDIFAPAAAHIASGKSPSSIGPKTTTIIKLPDPLPQKNKNTITGKIIHIDTFGNLISNIRQEHLPPQAPNNITITRIAGISIIGLSKTYSDKKPGELLAYIGSSGYLEIGMAKGAASSAIRTPAGRQISVFFKSDNAAAKT